MEESESGGVELGRNVERVVKTNEMDKQKKGKSNARDDKLRDDPVTRVEAGSVLNGGEGKVVGMNWEEGVVVG